MILDTASEDDLQWAAEIFGIDDVRFDAVGLVVKVGGERQAVIVYEGFSEFDCQMHIASNNKKRWFSRKMVASAFYLPFVKFGLRRVTALIPRRNEPSIILAIKLGFIFEGCMTDWYGDDDAMIYGMTKDSCPYLLDDRRIEDARMD